MAKLLTRIGFIDETSVKTNMAKTTGWAPRGERLVDHAPFGSWNTQTFIATLRHDRLDAPWVIGGPINRDLFERYVETQLAPTLQPGDVVRRGLEPVAAHASLLDNLSVHKSPKAAQTLRDIGCWFLPLPTWPLPNSKPSCARPPHAHTTISGKPSAPSATSSPKTSASTTSSPQAMNPIGHDRL
jgi:hypothetical protein